MFWVAFSALVCAAIPAGLFCWNLRLYRAPSGGDEGRQPVSVLIPARNEAGGLRLGSGRCWLVRGVSLRWW